MSYLDYNYITLLLRELRVRISKAALWFKYSTSAMFNQLLSNEEVDEMIEQTTEQINEMQDMLEKETYMK
ncbi:hypothetical protein [Paenibacillus yanchengensis]|uniref:Spo0E family sporulation regulatory protein-aspartic acid phosphatase n=1 Tax=Paenibacillus yanchengensis TaxID=2035833 RepID=A0ABW4YQI6_9BACL